MLVDGRRLELEGQQARGFSTGGRIFGYRTVAVPNPSDPLEPNGHPAIVSFGVGGEKGEEPHISSSARLELTGTMDEPVRDTHAVEIVVYPIGILVPARILCPGLAYLRRPTSVMAFWEQAELLQL